MEVIVATIIATIAVVGLAYSFGLGRSFITRFERKRTASAAARARLETLAVTPGTAPELVAPSTHTVPFQLDGKTLGAETWQVSWVDDPADGLAGAGDWNPNDLKRVTVEVTYRMGTITDTVTVTRLFPAL
jgi:hypothetical protein